MSFFQEVLSYLAHPQGVGVFVAICSIVTGILCEIVLAMLNAWVKKKDWWPRAMPLQKGLMMNFGYPEEACTELGCRSCYAYVLVLCGHHVICGCMMLPVVICGWAAVQTPSQVCFVIAVLMDVSLDVYDEFRMFAVTFLFESIGKKLFGGEKGPVDFFIVVGVLHHPLAMTMGIPLVLYYPDFASFHIIACALILAGGICFFTGSYKFTLDMTKVFDFYQFKAIVLIQFVTIIFTRGYIWFFHLYIILSKFRADQNMRLFYGGCVAGTLMSLFNLVLLADASAATKKWMPRSMAEEGTEDHDELVEDLVTMGAPAPSRGTIVGIGREVGLLAPAARVRANVTVLVAVEKFKKLLKKNRTDTTPREGYQACPTEEANRGCEDANEKGSRELAVFGSSPPAPTIAAVDEEKGEDDGSFYVGEWTSRAGTYRISKDQDGKLAFYEEKSITSSSPLIGTFSKKADWRWEAEISDKDTGKMFGFLQITPEQKGIRSRFKKASDGEWDSKGLLAAKLS